MSIQEIIMQTNKLLDEYRKKRDAEPIPHVKQYSQSKIDYLEGYLNGIQTALECAWSDEIEKQEALIKQAKKTIKEVHNWIQESLIQQDKKTIEKIKDWIHSKRWDGKNRVSEICSAVKVGLGSSEEAE